MLARTRESVSSRFSAIFSLAVDHQNLHRLLTQNHPLLPCLGARFPFEVAIGTNGRIWFKAPDTSLTIVFARAVEWVDDTEMTAPGTPTEAKIKQWLDANTS